MINNSADTAQYVDSKTPTPPVKNYDILIIGFGKAGKTFAKTASAQGLKVGVVEMSPAMYGGTCINIACIPSKTLVKASNEGLSFDEAMNRKHNVVSALNNKNYHMLADDDNIDIIDGVARFISDKSVEVLHDDQVIATIIADRIIINTGAEPIIPDIPGLASSRFAYTSTEALDLDHLPERIVIIGGGYIALEFASMLNTFGAHVTVLEKSDAIMRREDEDIAHLAYEDLKNAGIEFHLHTNTLGVEDLDSSALVHTSEGDFEADAILVAVGRRPRTQYLGLENTHISVGSRGEVIVNERLETSVPDVYAAGDVTGGMQFTYISLDDFRVLRSQIFGDGSRTTLNRGAIPYSVFITPTLSRIGLTRKEAQSRGFNIASKSLPVSSIPRHKINNDPRGLFTVVIDRDSQEILGASLYGDKSEELINYIKMAMDNHIPYTYIRDAIFTHPTMSESFNDLMNI
ncbi:FAD-containing oxidoreductase [Alloscardovia theropitheci]|uniref:FAD-containing oxidoreductase n=1 Tax=Alloscardovia theropitheci TaxID=2496842 RepID=A0A4R0QXR0_9BIFI|nr:hypothiocyanous acid reductase MerA [Alloscardovia theropitheci]TCD54440.1 FAD-containing oxidoreductase [Alloscardovia theropitheci]